jgi:ABC-type proline/glycine betaine transport system ATPase subunit
MTKEYVNFLVTEPEELTREALYAKERALIAANQVRARGCLRTRYGMQQRLGLARNLTKNAR